MRIILLALGSFFLSGVFLLPYMNDQLMLRQAYYLYAPIALMLIAILVQIDGAFMLRSVLKSRQILAENASLETELKDVTVKLHQEKKVVTDLKVQLASQEKDFRKLKSTTSQLEN